MAKFHIKPDSMTVMGGKKISMEVKFVSENSETEFMYHEVEGVEKDQVEEQLQLTADEWEKTLSIPEASVPDVETGKDSSVILN